MGTSITKENKVEDSFFVEQESSSSQTEQLSPRRLYRNTYMEIQATDKFEEGCLMVHGAAILLLDQQFC